MNPNHDEELLARWLDNELSADERTAFDARLAADAALRREAEVMQSLRTSLQSAFPRHTEVPHADFFNSRIQQSIDELRAEEARNAAAARPRFNWHGLRWFALAAACLVLGGVVWFWQQQEGPATIVMATYAPHTGVKASTFHSSDARATVLMLDGLEAVPADRKVVGYHVDHSETDRQVAMTTLFSPNGDVLGVLATDAGNQPHVITH
jgi:anti-sigma factor RsiW